MFKAFLRGPSLVWFQSAIALIVALVVPAGAQEQQSTLAAGAVGTTAAQNTAKPSIAAPLPPTTTQERQVNPIGLTEPIPFGWQPDFIGTGRGIFDLSFGVKAWDDKFQLRNLLLSGAVDLLPGLRARLELRRHEGTEKAFQVDLDEVYLEGFDQYRGRTFDMGASLRIGHIRYLHFPYPDAIALFDQVPVIEDLYAPTVTDYRTLVLEAETALHSGWGVHWTGRAAGFDAVSTLGDDVVEAYAFYRSDFGRGWHFEGRGGDIAVRQLPLGRAGQPGFDLYLGKKLGEFNIGLLFEHKRAEPDYTGIAVQFRPGPVTRVLGRYSIDYSRADEGLSAQVPVLHMRLNESRFVPDGGILVGEVRAVRLRTLWVQGFIRNEYEHRLEAWGETRDPRLRCVVTEEPWYLQTEALVSPHLLPDNQWLRDRSGPAQYVQRVTYRYYRRKPRVVPPGGA